MSEGMDRFYDTVAQLHRDAGSPSSRMLATPNLSHATIAKALARERVPKWVKAAILFKQLDVNPADYRQIWRAAWDEFISRNHDVLLRLTLSGSGKVDIWLAEGRPLSEIPNLLRQMADDFEEDSDG